jgi:hypothetical protein
LKLWVDDIRRPPDDSWVWARRNEDAMRVLRSGQVTECSLDHDMGLHEMDPDVPDADMLRIPDELRLEPDGAALVDEMLIADLVPTKVTIHSWNPVGAERMRRALLSCGHPCVITVAPFDPAVRA